MTEEKVKRGEELLKTLSHLRDQKQRWEKGEKFLHPEVCTIGEYGKVLSSMSIDESFINFDEIKLLAIAKIDRRIKEVQKEFDEL
jgi:hypothetical protein